MFAVVTPVLFLLASAAIYVCADPNPTSPGPGDVLVEGRPCTVNWDVDPTGRWKTMHIDLMTGDNFDMVFLANVGTVDGTNPNNATFTYTCLQVTPHSAIYFYQFSTPSSSNKTWTGRFAITDSTQEIVAPSRTIQPNGEKIPWGTGSLVDPSSVAPSFGASAAISDTRVIHRTSSAPLNTTSETPHLFAPSSSFDAHATPSPSTVSNTGGNGAMAMLSVSRVLVQTGLALGLAAFGFAAMS